MNEIFLKIKFIWTKLKLTECCLKLSMKKEVLISKLKKKKKKDYQNILISVNNGYGLSQYQNTFSNPPFQDSI